MVLQVKRIIRMCCIVFISCCMVMWSPVHLASEERNLDDASIMNEVLEPSERQSLAEPLNVETSSSFSSSEPHVEEPIVEKYMIDVAALSQLPEYVNGCEVTSLAMLTGFLKLPYSRQDLINWMPKDETPLILGENGDIEEWGDPNDGFVGDITGERMGYGIYNKPMEKLLNQIYAPGSLNLSGSPFTEIEKEIANNHPILIWTTSNFAPSSSWTEWHTQKGSLIEATFDEHVVLMVGYDDEAVYVNNPLDGEKAERVPKQSFIESWEQLGKQAITAH